VENMGRQVVLQIGQMGGFGQGELVWLAERLTLQAVEDYLRHLSQRSMRLGEPVARWHTAGVRVAGFGQCPISSCCLSQVIPAAAQADIDERAFPRQVRSGARTDHDPSPRRRTHPAGGAMTPTVSSTQA
jgi:hypothetical protein